MIEIHRGDSVIIPGSAVTRGQASAFADELGNGPYALVEGNITIVLQADALANPRKLDKLLEDRSVFPHSYGVAAVKRALQVITLNAVEPTSFLGLVKGVLGVASYKGNGHEVTTTRSEVMRVSALEIARRPGINLGLPSKVRRFSSVNRLIDLEDSFPMGRAMFFSDQDEYGFGGNGTIELAKNYGIHAEMIKGRHNDILFQPRDVLRQIHESIHKMNSVN